VASGVELRDVSVWRDDGVGGPPRQVLEGVELALAAGERAAIVGVNGAGKTSLLLALVGAVRFEGRIACGDLVLEKRTLEAVRRRIGFVFAEPMDQLFLHSVSDEVAFAPRLRGHSEQAVQERVHSALERVGLLGFETRAPSALSLGEQRRLALATALSGDPELLLLDEPTASLDTRARRAVVAALCDTGATLLVATHDLGLALELDARVVLLAAGRLLATGPARELLRDAALLDRAGLDPV
jgi:cobalt/nickel transport system ATP-binding protein